ncbi:MAG: aminoacyl-histidine dipeptidase [Spirochaetales bacterium]|nr:aminoacyl-histidine dipeptidase [Spirochaetales bacterium]
MDNDTQRIVEIFEQISAVPRQSKHEEKISAWLRDWAAQRSLDFRTDPKGNAVIDVPATEGFADAPVIVLQGHMDMVCEKTPESTHDFSKDPLKLIRDGDWITADGTTLGADNGIAIAMALAVVEDRSAAHPPLELLFTVDEETGLTGATALGSDFLNGRILINLDSEDEGVFTIGCAGGRDTILTFDIHRETINPEMKGVEIRIGGLSGGHSGVDIGKHRANANKLLTRVLLSMCDKTDCRLVSFTGGSARNAIPRDSRAVVSLSADQVKNAQTIAGLNLEVFRKEYAAAEKDLSVSVEPISLTGMEAFSPVFCRNFLDLLNALPNGVRGYSADIHGLVETSCNLAYIEEEGGKLKIHTSQRSSVMSRLDEIAEVITSAGRLAEAEKQSENSYPAWTPDTGSRLLEKAKKIYKQVFSEEAKVEAIHAGLECGVIGSKYEGMDMISLGPTIKHPHSPDEKVNIPSVGRTWGFLKALLADFN